VAEVTDRLSFRLGLGDDVAAFYALAADDPPFQRVVERLHGYHQVKFPSPLELLCWAILGQRAPLPVARRMKQAIVARAANGIVVDGRELWAFPDLEQLLELTQDELAGLIANRRKAAYLHGAFRHWQEIDEAFLRSGDREQVRQRLLEIPGVGRWSSTFLMVRGLGRTETIGPAREGRLAAGRVGRTLTDAQFVELAGRYEGQGYWGHYLRVGG
jgi:DNA-3-methyladenine glycosylase II